MAIWHSTLTLNDLNNRGKNTMVEYLSINFIEMGEDYLIATMPVDHRTKQCAGIMHGGASCILAETLGSLGANICVDAEQYHCVGLEINTNHIHSIREGLVTGLARPFHLGKSTQVWHIEIKNEASQLISINRLTMAVLKRERYK